MLLGCVISAYNFEVNILLRLTLKKGETSNDLLVLHEVSL